MPLPPLWARCPVLFAPTGPRCELSKDHPGPHNAAVIWGSPDDVDTIQLPPIRDSIGHRRRPPSLPELSDRAELIEAMQAELRRDLAELRDVEDSGGDDL